MPPSLKSNSKNSSTSEIRQHLQRNRSRHRRMASTGMGAAGLQRNRPIPSTVLQHHYPNVPNLGDITKIDWNPYKGQADLVVGGSPCFPSGTLILTSERLKPIEEVKVGDMVLTHLNRWRRVIQTGSKISDTIVLKGQGVSSLECTPNHPFWSTGKTKKQAFGHQTTGGTEVA